MVSKKLNLRRKKRGVSGYSGVCGAYVHTSTLKQPPPLPFPLFAPCLTTSISLALPLPVSDHPAATNPELSCKCCCQSSQIQSHHCHSSVSALAIITV